VNVRNVVGFSEVHTASIFRVEVCKSCEFLCIHKIMFFEKKRRENKGGGLVPHVGQWGHWTGKVVQLSLLRATVCTKKKRGKKTATNAPKRTPIQVITKHNRNMEAACTSETSAHRPHHSVYLTQNSFMPERGEGKTMDGRGNAGVQGRIGDFPRVLSLGALFLPPRTAASWLTRFYICNGHRSSDIC
jgi:hypothetical protein